MSDAVRSPLRALVAGLVTAVLLTACGGEEQGSDVDPEQADAVETPTLGSCRNLSPEDVSQPGNATRTVDCSEDHTAETYAVGSLPAKFDDAAFDDREVGRFAYKRCSETFETFLGADESLVMRTIVSWAWFRPSEQAWDDGARWYRCDVVGGGEQSVEYVNLPKTAKGLMLGTPDDRWMVCVNGPSVTGSVKIPCAEPHNWRAVTTIKLGQDDDGYPGERLAEVRSRDFCSDSVGAWLNYPVNYDFGYTWFGEGEWQSGNRRSICWAKTED